jgi:4-amino-4-deoxy-L-arabinose transferase-like glycosyltransferase
MKKIKDSLNNTTLWIKDNKLEAALLALILVVGAVLRLYRIPEYMTFLGDEGRDAIVVRRLLVEADPILIGPGTSIGDMYLGPLYYYLMAPFLLLAGYSPVGPAVMVALLGVATIFFVWYVTAGWFGEQKVAGVSLHVGALMAAVLYAIAPVVIYYSRSSWNPNIMPFFALLTIYSIWKFWARDEYRWMVVGLISFAFVLQSHYLGLLLIPVIGLFWFLKLVSETRKVGGVGKLKLGKLIRGDFVKHSLVSFGIFLLLMSPLVIFDFRHDWMNFKAMKKFFLVRQTTVSARPWTALPKLEPLFRQFNERIIAGKNETAGRLVSAVTALGLATSLLFWKKLEKSSAKALFLLLVWLGAAFVGFGVYKQHIYDHYFGFIYPAGFILLGGLSAIAWKKLASAGKLLVVLAFIGLVYVNLLENPLKYEPNRQYPRSIAVAEKVLEVSDGEPFNFAVIAERNYESGYMYLFERWDSPAVRLIADKPETISDQLFVVCEVTGEKCNPETNDRPELAWFGWRKIVASWEVQGVKLFKLVHAN